MRTVTLLDWLAAPNRCANLVRRKRGRQGSERSRWFWVAVAVMGLAGCGHVPLATMWKLRSFDATAIDPAAFRAGVQLPEVLGLRPDSLRLTLRYWPEGEPQRRKEVPFRLRTLGDAASVALAQRLAPGRNTVLLDIEPGDIGALTALQALVRADRAAGRGTPRGNLSLHIDLCRRAALPDTPLRVTTLVKLDQGSEFLTLLDGVEVRDWVEPGKTLEEEAPPCE